MEEIFFSSECLPGINHYPSAGHPLPILAWTRGDVTFNTTSTVVSPPGAQESLVVSSLQLTGLARDSDGAELQCLAHSQASHAPLVRTVTLDLICKLDLNMGENMNQRPTNAIAENQICLWISWMAETVRHYSWLHHNYLQLDMRLSHLETFELTLLVMSGHTCINDNILNLSLSHGPVLLFISFWICILCSECEERGEM